MKNIRIHLLLVLVIAFYSCSSGSKSSNPVPPPAAGTFNFKSSNVNGINNAGYNYVNVNSTPVIKLSFTAGINTASVNSNIVFKNTAGAAINYTATYQNNDSTITIVPSAALAYLSKYTITINTGLKSTKSATFASQLNINLSTSIDSTNKFPIVSDDQLLTLVQQQTFKYFWDFGHPISGLARERNTSGDVVTAGGSGLVLWLLLQV